MLHFAKINDKFLNLILLVFFVRAFSYLVHINISTQRGRNDMFVAN